MTEPHRPALVSLGNGRSSVQLACREILVGFATLARGGVGHRAQARSDTVRLATMMLTTRAKKI